MNLLLDTHVLIRWLVGERRFVATTRELLRDPGNRILVSSASAWEIATKYRLGKLTGVDALARDVAGWVSRAGFDELSIAIAYAHRAGSFTQEHLDPFDRLLAAQSECEDVPIVTGDAAFRTFGVRVAW